MVYLVKMVIFHGYVSHNQMVWIIGISWSRIRLGQPWMDHFSNGTSTNWGPDFQHIHVFLWCFCSANPTKKCCFFLVLDVYWLVLWNHGILWLSIQLGDQLTDFHIFQRGRYTTNQVYFVDQTLEVSAMKLLNLIQHMRRLDTGRLVGTCCVRMSIIGVQWYTYYPLVICYIAIENRPFIWYLPIKDGDFP